jgi:transcriptional regulator with XRE-family HTH domain
MAINVPERLELLLKHFKINQKQLSKLADLSENTISNAKKGKNIPNIDFFNNISKAFPSINPNWLYRGEGEMLHEFSADQKSPNKEILDDAMERMTALEKEVALLRSQIQDKEEIIRLLKKTQEEPSAL